MEDSETESSSSGSTSSSSCSDSGSSSDTESSSSAVAEEKQVPPQSNAKTTNPRQRKSSEFKATTKPSVTENEAPPKPKTAALISAASKVRAVASQRNIPSLTSDDDDDDEVPTIKRTPAKRKTSVVGAKTGGKNASKVTNQTKSGGSRVTENGDRKHLQLSSTNETDDSLKETNKNARKIPTKMATSTVRAKQLRNKPPPKRTTLTKATTAVAAASANNAKSSESSDSGSESGSGSGDDSSSGSESEESDSTNSYSSQHNARNAKQKRGAKPPRSDTDDNVPVQTHPIRKLTRSLSMRRPKQQPVKQGSDSDSDADLDGDKHSLSKSPAKKPAAGFNNSAASKCKVTKEIGGLVQLKSRPISPIVQLEKKCPIEGCDSSGHLSGNLDRHFLPEACPIYHNMSASECKERANERKLRNEQRQKLPINIATAPGSAHTANRTLTPEQKEFLAKIRESRARFRPISNSISDKVKLEKDCTDEDREPNLGGLVPDYDLQLFREAQALASEKIEDELKDLPVGKGIKYITMGKYKMKVWYQSPYPDDAARLPKMYICEFCLRYQKSETGIKRHAQKCVWRHPPGDEIYRKGKLQVWQVDGKRYKQYCQHLCLLAKFFLDHKTLYYDVEPFLFYIMTLADVDGCHIVGYFSKEKNSFYNVSCILTLPPYQRKGYGRLLIDFSYLLTRVEGKIGSPEKPLSDLGLISYRSYWKDVLLDYLCNRTGNTLSIKDVSQEMAIYSYDIVSTLQWLGMMKYWKGKHIVLKKQDVLDEYEERVKRRGTFPKIDDSCLRWQPFVPTQPNTSP